MPRAKNSEKILRLDNQDQSTCSSIPIRLTSLIPVSASRLEQRRSPRARRKECAEQNDRIDTGSSLRRPVHVAKIQPQGELVQRQRCADAIQN